MPIAPAINPGKVDWSGENPGILLKEDPDGPWSAMALFFRIVTSPAGRGHALLLYEDPNVEDSLPAVHNVMLSDNESLARYLMANFIAKLPSFAGAPAFKAVRYLPVDSVHSEGDPRSRYAEVVKAPGLEVRLDWDELGQPVALELPAILGMVIGGAFMASSVVRLPRWAREREEQMEYIAARVGTLVGALPSG